MPDHWQRDPPPGLAGGVAQSAQAERASYADVRPDDVRWRERLPQGPPPDESLGLEVGHYKRWAAPDGGWKDTGGALIHLRFGLASPRRVFSADGWGLDWLLPPGEADVDSLLMHDLRWEHLVASALSPMGTGGLGEFVPTVVVPHVGLMIERLLQAGFSKCYLKQGAESHLGAWAMDCAWNALRVFYGETKSTAKGDWVGNATYVVAAKKMAADCNVQLSAWTVDVGGTTKPVEIGNIVEAYATLLVKRRAWAEFASIMYYMAHHDAGGLVRYVSGRPQVGVVDQVAPPPPILLSPLAT